MVFAEFVADLQVIIYQNSPEHKNFSNNFEPGIFFLLDLRTFNMADRGSYACLYGGKINGDTNHHQQVNIVQSASGSWTLGRQIFANTFGWPCRSVVFTPQTGSGFSDDKITSEEQSFVKLCKLLVF